MTRKRFTKLFYALMQEMNKDHLKTCGTSAKNWGRVLKAVSVAHPFPNDKGVTSYEECWENLKSIRNLYGM